MSRAASWAEVQARAARPPQVLERWRAARQGARNMTAREFAEWLGEINPNGGPPVTEQSAMRISAVYAAIDLVAGAVTMAPCQTYRRIDERRRAPVRGDLWWLLNEQPNPAMSAASFWRYMVAARMLHGDAFATIVRRDRSPDVYGLVPRHPRAVEPVRGEQGEIVYRVLEDDGRVVAYDGSDVLHVPSVGFDGLRSVSAIKAALGDAGGIALAAADFSSAYFSRGLQAQVAFAAPGDISDEEIARLKAQVDEKHSGRNGMWRPMVLTHGMKVERLSMSAEDAQLLDARRFQIEDIARLFGVPPHMIGHTEKSTAWGTGLEQMSIGFVRYRIAPICRAFEQEINRKLYRRATGFVEFNLEGLMRGDSKARSDAYRAALGGPGSGDGWMTPDEIRLLENMPDEITGELYRAPRDVGDSGNA